MESAGLATVASVASIDLTPRSKLPVPLADLAFDSIEITTPFEVRDLALAPVKSVARNGRSTPIPEEPVADLARHTIPSIRTPPTTGMHMRFLLPLGAAFLALGVVLGILLFFPAI